MHVRGRRHRRFLDDHCVRAHVPGRDVRRLDVEERRTSPQTGVARVRVERPARRHSHGHRRRDPLVEWQPRGRPGRRLGEVQLPRDGVTRLVHRGHHRVDHLEEDAQRGLARGRREADVAGAHLPQGGVLGSEGDRLGSLQAAEAGVHQHADGARQAQRLGRVEPGARLHAQSVAREEHLRRHRQVVLVHRAGGKARLGERVQGQQNPDQRKESDPVPHGTSKKKQAVRLIRHLRNRPGLLLFERWSQHEPTSPYGQDVIFLRARGLEVRVLELVSSYRR